MAEKKKKIRQRGYGSLFVQMACNPIFIAVYAISWRYFYSLCKVGRVRRNVPILAACAVFYVIYLGIYLVRCYKYYKRTDRTKPSCKGVFASWFWRVPALLIILAITVTAGYYFKTTMQMWNSKLGYYLYDHQDEKNAPYVNDNIYEDGMEGFLESLSVKLDIGSKVTYGPSFAMNFKPDGTVTYLAVLIYTYDQQGKNTGSYYVNYDASESKSMVYEPAHISDHPYKSEKDLNYLKEIIDRISLEEAISGWNEKEYGILCYGYRDWPSGTDGIVYLYQNGDREGPDMIQRDQSGYTVSLYCTKDESITPLRYIYNQYGEAGSATENGVFTAEHEEEHEYDSNKLVNMYQEEQYKPGDEWQITEDIQDYNDSIGFHVYQSRLDQVTYIGGDKLKETRVNQGLESVYQELSEWLNDRGQEIVTESNACGNQFEFHFGTSSYIKDVVTLEAVIEPDEPYEQYISFLFLRNYHLGNSLDQRLLSYTIDLTTGDIVDIYEVTGYDREELEVEIDRKFYEQQGYDVNQFGIGIGRNWWSIYDSDAKRNGFYLCRNKICIYFGYGELTMDEVFPEIQLDLSE